MNFCELTLGDGRKTYVNLDLVYEIYPSTRGGSLLLSCGEKDSEVKETPKQIIYRINTGRMD